MAYAASPDAAFDPAGFEGGGVSLIVAPKISKDPSKSKKWAKRSYLPGDL
jgi:hypothetical protein